MRDLARAEQSVVDRLPTPTLASQFLDLSASITALTLSFDQVMISSAAPYSP
ncbi:hypothetical protein [Nonomuraea sp. B19D2]|uniref:hypothetical protein n=1 Tax=Nonomuraea sp. B19D2 TaxID=3159561 RepID=UPI0032DB145B